MFKVEFDQPSQLDLPNVTIFGTPFLDNSCCGMAAIFFSRNLVRSVSWALRQHCTQLDRMDPANAVTFNDGCQTCFAAGGRECVREVFRPMGSQPILDHFDLRIPTNIAD